MYNLECYMFMNIQALITGIELNDALHQSIENLLTVIPPTEHSANHLAENYFHSDYSLSSLVSYNINVDSC